MEKGGGVIGLEYWLKWQVFVCGVIIIIPAIVSLTFITNNNTSKSTTTNYLWVPCWINFPSSWLLVYRAFAFLSMAWLLYQMILFAGPFAFYFYTQWTFTLVMLYFAVGTIISAQGCFVSSSKKTKAKDGEKDKSSFTNASEETNSLTNSGLQKTKRNRTNLQNHNGGDDNEPTQDANPLGHLMLILYQTSAGASILTDLVFWLILVPMLKGTDFKVTLLIGSIHSVNAVFLIIDSILNRLPFEWFGFNYFILWTVTYVTFQWILHACGSTRWPYPFLELSTPLAPLWYLGMAAIHVPCYGVYILLVKTKNSTFSKLFPQAFVRSDEQGWSNKKAA